MTVAVIGTGLAGLACARVLAEGGEKVVLLDKSKGYGGRMASRRRGDFAFDHGLPAFDPIPAETIPALADLPEWGAYGRVGTPRMNAFPREIGEGFESRMGARIMAIDARTLDLTDEEGARHGGFSRVVVAIPAPQAAALLHGHGDAFAPAGAATYEPGITLMLGGGAGDAAGAQRMTPQSGPLASIIRDDLKPGRMAGSPCHVAHACTDWAAANLERDPDAIARDLCIAFAALTGLDPTDAAYCTAHRWRYCHVARGVEAPFLISADGRIGACGDWCGADRGGGDARAAWRSGEAAGRAMLG